MSKQKTSAKMDESHETDAVAAAVASALEDAGSRYIARVCGEVAYGAALRLLLVRSKTYTALAGAVDTEDAPINVFALRGIDKRTIALRFLAPVFAEAAVRDASDLATEDFVAYASRRLVVSRARNTRERAAEALIDCLSEHVPDSYFDDEFGPACGARYKAQARGYTGEELTRSVFSACRTMDGIAALIHSEETGFDPLDEMLGPMDATERVVVPVLAAMIGTDEASVLRSLFVRMVRASPTPLGPWCSEWTRVLSRSDVVRLAPRFVELGLTAALRNVRDVRTLLVEGLALDATTLPRLVSADVARVAHRLSPKAVDALARSVRHAPTIMRVLAHDALVVRRACQVSTDLPCAVRLMRTARDRRSVHALAGAISRIAADSTDAELVDSLRACGDGAVHAFNALDDRAFERAMRAVRRFRPKGLCHFVISRMDKGAPRGVAMFDACFA